MWVRHLKNRPWSVMACHFREIFLFLGLCVHEFISKQTLFNLTTACSVVKSISQIGSKSWDMFILPASRTMIFTPCFKLWRGTILVPRALQINTLSQTKHYSPMTHSGCYLRSFCLLSKHVALILNQWKQNLKLHYCTLSQGNVKCLFGSDYILMGLYSMFF